MQQDFFLRITDTMVNYWHLKHWLIYWCLMQCFSYIVAWKILIT